MIDNNTKFEIQNEVEIFCVDLQFMTFKTNRLFDPKWDHVKAFEKRYIPHTVPTLKTKGAFQCNPCECGGHPDCPECGNWPESDGYLGSGRPCSR
jgi:hypothetical protein